MMEYVVVEEFDPEAMGNRVDEFFDDGWELYGNLYSLLITHGMARTRENSIERFMRKP